MLKTKEAVIGKYLDQLDKKFKEEKNYKKLLEEL
jgi:hypothetical protein